MIINQTVDGVLQSVPMLAHEGLISLIIKILWTHGFHKDINFDDLAVLDGVITLAGAVLSTNGVQDWCIQMS